MSADALSAHDSRRRDALFMRAKKINRLSFET
jgi:hypothetical protein